MSVYCNFAGNRSEDGRREGEVKVVWPVGWVVIAGAAEGVGGCDGCKAGVVTLILEQLLEGKGIWSLKLEGLY